MSTPGWTQRRQRFIPADAFCFSQLNCSSRHKNCLLSLSKPNALSCPFSCPPACLVSSPVSFSCYSGNPYIFISYLNVFQLPLSDLPLNHRPLPPPSPRYFFYLSLFLILIRLSPVCLTRASFHFISFDDNLSFPIRLPRSPPLFSPGRSPSFSSPPPGSRLRRQCVVRHLTERQQKKKEK